MNNPTEEKITPKISKSLIPILDIILLQNAIPIIVAMIPTVTGNPEIKDGSDWSFKFLNKLFNEHISGKKDNYRKIWTVYTFIKWYQVFFENE